MATLSQYIMQVDNQNKQNRQQILSNVMPALNAMYQSKLKMEADQNAIAREREMIDYRAGVSERTAIAKEKRDYANMQEEIKFKNAEEQKAYEKKLALQTAEEIKRAETVPLTKAQTTQKNLEQQRINLAGEKASGTGKEAKPTYTQKEINTANLDLTNAQKTHSANKQRLGISPIKPDASEYYATFEGKKYYNKNGQWRKVDGKYLGDNAKGETLKELNKIDKEYKDSLLKYQDAQRKQNLVSGKTQATPQTSKPQQAQQTQEQSYYNKYEKKIKGIKNG